MARNEKSEYPIYPYSTTSAANPQTAGEEQDNGGHQQTRSMRARKDILLCTTSSWDHVLKGEYKAENGIICGAHTMSSFHTLMTSENIPVTSFATLGDPACGIVCIKYPSMKTVTYDCFWDKDLLEKALEQAMKSAQRYEDKHSYIFIGKVRIISTSNQMETGNNIMKLWTIPNNETYEVCLKVVTDIYRNIKTFYFIDPDSKEAKFDCLGTPVHCEIHFNQ